MSHLDEERNSLMPPSSSIYKRSNSSVALSHSDQWIDINQSTDSTLIKDHNMKQSRFLSRNAGISLLVISWIITLSLIVLLAASINDSTNQSISQTMSSKWVQSLFHHADQSTPALATAEQWIVDSNSIEFMREHGVFVNVASERISVVSNSAVEQLTQHINQHQLVDGYNNTLFVGIINKGYFDMAANFMCFIQRLKLTNFLLGAVDQYSYDRMHVLGYGKHVVPLYSLFNDSSLKLCSDPASFRQTCFNKQTQMKSQFVLTALLGGFTAILTDMDIIFMHNPLLYMPLVHDWEMVLEPQEWCTGFYVNKPTAINIAMQTQVVAGMIGHPDFDDQKIYNEWIRYHRFIAKDTMDKHLFPISIDLFPNGQQFGNFSGVIQHNNWILGSGAKRDRAKRLNLWLYNATNTDDVIKQYLTSVASTSENDAQHLHQSRVNLQCDACHVCDKYIPYLPKLRDTFPGPLLISNISAYRGGLKEHA